VRRCSTNLVRTFGRWLRELRNQSHVRAMYHVRLPENRPAYPTAILRSRCGGSTRILSIHKLETRASSEEGSRVSPRVSTSEPVPLVSAEMASKVSTGHLRTHVSSCPFLVPTPPFETNASSRAKVWIHLCSPNVRRRGARARVFFLIRETVAVIVFNSSSHSSSHSSCSSFVSSYLEKSTVLTQGRARCRGRVDGLHVRVRFVHFPKCFPRSAFIVLSFHPKRKNALWMVLSSGPIFTEMVLKPSASFSLSTSCGVRGEVWTSSRRPVASFPREILTASL
jgi:hypothetical protein